LTVQHALVQRAIRLEYLTVGWNTVEAIVAIAAGAAAGSIALEGFGLDSIVETASGLALLWRFRQKGLAQEEAETRAARLVGITFFVLAAYVGYIAVSDLWLHRPPLESLAGLILAAVSLVVMPILGFAKRRLAKNLQSKALAADSQETLLCAYLSASLLAGLGLNAWLGWWWTDPAAGLLMVVWMVREGVEANSTKEASP
jgi:divalent metal cation (Fe/Co/Zn/Cd) transporter